MRVLRSAFSGSTGIVFVSIACAVASIVLPLVASAAVASFTPEKPVTRIGFIRGAVYAIGVSLEGYMTGALPKGVTVSKEFEPYVRYADRRGILKDVVGLSPLNSPVTVGQALSILRNLKAMDPTENLSRGYKDVKSGSSEAEAVSLAIEQGWILPLRADFFGVRRILKGAEAELLLRRVTGEVSTKTIPSKLQKQKSSSASQTLTVRLGSAATGTLPKAELLEAIWKIVNDEYLREETINPDEAAYKAAEGLINSLKDPYSSFMRPSNASNLETQLSGQVSGIGAQVEQRSGVLTIVTPLPGSPSERAGLLPNDEILKVDGLDISGLDFLEAVDKVRGPKGTSVKLHIRRAGSEFDISVIRDNVVVPEVVVSQQGNVAIIKLVQFGKVTEEQLRDKMVEIGKQNPSGIILDLRNNPGGLLHAADIVVSNFVPAGTPVAHIIARSGTRIESTEEEQTVRPTVPLVVLVNEGSASASEIVAGALQDAGRATVVGKKTFGKGTVQEVLRFNDQSGLKLTVAEWRTPLDRKIDGVGIQPDVVVEGGSGRDDQLLKALDILR
ncbi:MAG: S41 family peptidase [Candidatus Peregrinibacteria bacterium]